MIREARSFYDIKHYTAITVEPTVWPIGIEEAKLSARISGSDEDSLIERYVKLATKQVEIDSRRALLTQTIALYLDQFPGRTIYLERPPVQSVSTIRYVDTDGTTQTLSSTLYTTDLASEPCRITPAYGQTWPFTRFQTNAVTVTFVAGFTGQEFVPEFAKHAIALLVGEWYRNREATGTMQGELQFSYSACVSRLSWGIYV